MKDFSQTVLQKGLFVSIKGHLCLTKGHLDNPEGQMEIKSTSSEIIFDANNSNRKNYSNRALFKACVYYFLSNF